MNVIGLTGGIGTGKTHVSKILEDLGAVAVYADLVGHEVYRPHTEAWKEIVNAFGEEALTNSGAVDRKKLSAIVFSDPIALSQLNAITHPRIYQEIEERIQTLRSEGTRVVVVEAALLVEANWLPLVNEVWVIRTPESQVVERLKRYKNLDDEAIRSRIRSQMHDDERARYADVLIENRGSIAELRDRVQQLWNNRVATDKGE